MKRVYDLAVKTGTYQKDGQTKNRYEKIGNIFEGDNGMFMVLNRTFNPAGVPNPDNKTSVIVSMFQAGDSKPASTADKVKNEFKGSDNPFTDDDVPF